MIVYSLNKEAKMFITYYDIIKFKGISEEFKMKILTKLRKLEKEILKLKGRKREEAMKLYRKLLFSLRDEPIYLLRC